MRILKPGRRSGSGFRSGGKTGDSCASGRQLDFAMLDNSVEASPAAVSGAMSKQADKQIRSPEGLPKKEYDRLLGKGIRLLSMREHSVQEMTTKLSGKGENLNLVHAVVDELLNLNYLSDQRFTESYVRSRQNRGFGPNKIRKELISKGIKNNMIEDYLNVNSSVWFDNAENQYRKKFGDEPVKDYSSWAKRARFMQSRGFSMEHIQVTLPSIDQD